MNKKGFTLVELVIVIAIVIILSLVSVPIYRSYTEKAKWSEGYALLGTILSAQKAYYSEYGMFLHASAGSAKAAEYTCNDEILGIDAQGNKYFTSFAVGFHSPNSTLREAFHAVVKIPQDISIGGKSYIALWYSKTAGGATIN